MSPSKSGVYEIRNTINGKRYVGSTVNIRKRERQHWRSLRGNYHINGYLQNAWNKYSEDAFVFKVLHTIYPVNLIAVEQGEIDTKSEYNLRQVAGSSLGYKHTDKAKAKMAAASKGNHYGLGYKHTDEAKTKMSEAGKRREVSAETRAKMAAAQTGKKHTDEAKAKMSKAQKGHSRNLGYKHTAESKAKMSEAMKERPPEFWAKMSVINKGRKHTPEAKANMAAAQTGKKHTDEAKAKMSAWNHERWKDPKERAKMSTRMKGNKHCLGRKLSDEHKAKISAGGKGRKLSDETKAKISAAQKKRLARRKAKGE